MFHPHILHKDFLPLYAEETESQYNSAKNRLSSDALEDSRLLESKLRLSNEDEMILELCSRGLENARSCAEPTPLLSSPPLLCLLPFLRLSLISEGLDALLPCRM